MRFFDLYTLPSILPFLVVLFVGLLMYLLVKRAISSWQKRYREPFHQNLLRPPGWGCLRRREDAAFDISAISAALPALWGGVAMIALFGSKDNLIGACAVALAISIFLLRKLGKRVNDARTAYIGFLGELAVAESLEGLVQDGWKTFHDFVVTDTDKPFNIDHIAVGPTGIFAIETKARSKPLSEKFGSNDARVDHDYVRLSDGRKLEPLGQAKKNALTLRNWLRLRGVEVTFVEPIAVLPGWSVKYKTNKSNRQIRDPRNLAAYIAGHDSQLDKISVNKATEVIEGYCRSLKFSDVGF